MKLVFDIETDGLYQDSKNIWCMVAVDEDDNSYSFKQDEIDKGIELLKSADVIIGHNIIGFDVPVIKKLIGVDLYQHTKVLDTLTLSPGATNCCVSSPDILKWVAIYYS